MIKAIAILQELLNYEEEAKAKVEIQEAIAELQTTQAKLETERDKYNIIAANLQSSRGKVLMYLEDLETRISDFKMWLQDKVDDGAEKSVCPFGRYHRTPRVFS